MVMAILQTLGGLPDLPSPSCLNIQFSFSSMQYAWIHALVKITTNPLRKPFQVLLSKQKQESGANMPLKRSEFLRSEKAGCHATLRNPSKCNLALHQRSHQIYSSSSCIHARPEVEKHASLCITILSQCQLIIQSKLAI